MTIIGSDHNGNVYAIAHGLTRSTLYRGTPKRARHGLHDLGEGGFSGGGGFDWSSLLTGLSPIIAGVGQRIAGQPQGTVPIQPYPQQLVATAGIGGLSTTTMMMIGGGALGLILLLKK